MSSSPASSSPASSPAAAHPLGALMRRFAVDWLDRADTGAAAEIFHPDYVMEISGFVARGRDEAYLPATTGQLARFPGLLITVHDLFLATDPSTGEDRAALRFTEHGPSARDGEGAAAWRGVSLFRTDGERLTHNATEEDYAGRRRQLQSGECDAVEGPTAAPWAAAPSTPDAETEETVRRWLRAGGLADRSALAVDDGWLGHPTPPVLDVDSLEIRDLFSAGDRVGFHVVESGRYRDGLGLPDAMSGAPATLSSVGMVRVAAGREVSGHVVRDRSGLRRTLVEEASRAGTA